MTNHLFATNANGATKMIEGRKVKAYFRKNGTVAKWWNPTEDDYAQIYQKQTKIVTKLLRKIKPKTCLEVSCGKGRTTKEISHLCKNFISSDISQEMLTIAKKNTPHVKFIQADAERLPIKSNTQDTVICLEAFVHYPNPQKALSEFHRVLKIGGTLILDSDNKYSLRRMIKKTLDKIIECSHTGRNIFSYYSKSELVSLVKKSGFKIKIFKYIGTGGPIRITTRKGSKFHIIPVWLSKFLFLFPLDHIPFIRNIATYHLIVAEK